MRGINHVILFGHLGATPELRTTPNGRAVCDLSLATNRPVKSDDGWRETTDWHRVTLWEREAEMAARLLSKGSAVGIEGQLRTDSWEDRATGQKRYRTYVVGHKLHLLGGRAAEATPDAGTAERSAPLAHAAVEEEEIPF